jgi:hypothetical protein
MGDNPFPPGELTRLANQHAWHPGGREGEEEGERMGRVKGREGGKERGRGGEFNRLENRSILAVQVIKLIRWETNQDSSR